MDKMWSQSCDSNYTNNLITYTANVSPKKSAEKPHVAQGTP